MQQIVTASSRERFEEKVNDLLSEGWTIVSDTIAATSFPTPFKQSTSLTSYARWINNTRAFWVVLEKVVEKSRFYDLRPDDYIRVHPSGRVFQLKTAQPFLQTISVDVEVGAGNLKLDDLRSKFEDEIHYISGIEIEGDSGVSLRDFSGTNVIGPNSMNQWLTRKNMLH